VIFRGGSVLYTDSAHTIQVRAPITLSGWGASGQLQSYPANALNGITISVNDPSAQFVQFFYRERIGNQDAMSTAEKYKDLMHAEVGGAYLRNGNLSGWANLYSPWMYYDLSEAGPDVVVDEAGNGFRSLVKDNNWNTPASSPGEWAPEAAVSCLAGKKGPDGKDGTNGKGCRQLTSDPSHPTWILDGHAKDSPVYTPDDTVYGCDYAVTLFDTPNLVQGYGPETWRFTAYDFVIINQKLTWVVVWVKEKKANTINVEPTITVTVQPAGGLPFGMLNGLVNQWNSQPGQQDKVKMQDGDTNNPKPLFKLDKNGNQLLQ
jgi:hypothetical protein